MDGEIGLIDEVGIVFIRTDKDGFGTGVFSAEQVEEVVADHQGLVRLNLECFADFQKGVGVWFVGAIVLAGGNGVETEVVFGTDDFYAGARVAGDQSDGPVLAMEFFEQLGGTGVEL